MLLYPLVFSCLLSSLVLQGVISFYNFKKEDRSGVDNRCLLSLDVDICNFFQLINWLHHHAVLVLSVGVGFMLYVVCSCTAFLGAVLIFTLVFECLNGEGSQCTW